MYYVYLLKNNKIGTTYLGYTNNLKRRLEEHIAKSPDLVYYEAFKSEKDARTRERMLKQGQTVRRLKERLINSLS